mmetsp:Transcript_20834/g.52546  ORF Transcript_20834/g.52546 Transcript_20834/m.52546 type:complete len:252 (+) Transcript_20834:430-1185(+)
MSSLETAGRDAASAAQRGVYRPAPAGGPEQWDGLGEGGAARERPRPAARPPRPFATGRPGGRGPKTELERLLVHGPAPTELLPENGAGAGGKNGGLEGKPRLRLQKRSETRSTQPRQLPRRAGRPRPVDLRCFRRARALRARRVRVRQKHAGESASARPAAALATRQCPRERVPADAASPGASHRSRTPQRAILGYDRDGGAASAAEGRALDGARGRLPCRARPPQHEHGGCSVRLSGGRRGRGRQDEGEK